MSEEVWFDDSSVGTRGEMFRPVGTNTWRIYALPKAFKVDSTPDEQIQALLKRKDSGLVEEVEFSDGKYVLWWTAVAEKIHYVEKLRRSIICLSTEDKVAECCKLTGTEPFWYGMFPVLVYLTKPDGTPLEEPKQSIVNAQVMLWKVNENRFGQIRAEHKMNPISVSDLMLAGKQRGEFTQISIRAVQPALVRRSAKAFEHFCRKAQPLWNVAPGRFGRKMSEDELRAELGMTSGTSEIDDSILDVDL